MPEFAGTITEPGLYADIPEDAYHRDPVPESEGRSLSVTSSKWLIPDSPPAKFAWAREHGHRPSGAQKLGTVTHSMVLGVGPELAVLEFETRRGGDYKKEEAEALQAGLLPVLRKDYDEARAIADALLSHPTAGALLAGIDAEVSMFWIDPDTGIWLRGRMDGHTLQWPMPTILDVKTSKDASPSGFAKSAADYGYHRQDPHYREGLAAALGCDWRDIDFIFIVVETEPPYCVATYRLSDGSPCGPYGAPGPDDVALGCEENKIAREIYRACTEAGRWPGYSQEIETLQLPRYRRQQIERTVNEWYE